MSECSGLTGAEGLAFDHRLALLAHELGDVVGPRRLCRLSPEHFQPPKDLYLAEAPVVAPRRQCAIGHACLDVPEKFLLLDFICGKDSRRKAVLTGVTKFKSFVQRLHFGHSEDGREEFLLKDTGSFGKLVHDGRLDEITARKLARLQHPSAVNNSAFVLTHLYCPFIFLDRCRVDEWPEEGVFRNRIADLQGLGLFHNRSRNGLYVLAQIE